MKEAKKLLTMLLAVTLMFSLTIQPAFAATSVCTAYSLYDNEDSETVNIGGISYTYRYYYENGNRAIDIVNNESGHIDRIIFDETALEMYLNGRRVSMADGTAPTVAPAYTDGWESLGTDSYYISWGEATTAAVVAGMIAAYLGSLGTSGVVAAMGLTALSIIAANSSGGTLTVEWQWYNIPLVAPQYRYIWSFTASTGDKYGPYISHVTF